MKHFASLILMALAVLAGSQGTQIGTVADRVLPIIGHSTLVGHANPAQIIHLGVNLRVPSPRAFAAFVDSVNDPRNPAYGRFVTPKEIGQRFGQPGATVQSIVTFLRTSGFHIKLVDADNLHILADGSVAQAEAAFHTKINRYHATSSSVAGHQDFFANSTAPSVPASFASTIQHLSGLESFTQPRRLTLDCTQTRTLYDTAPIYNSGMQGQGRTVAISSFDGYRLSNVPLYYAQFGLPTPSGGVGSNITVITIDGGSGSGDVHAEGDLDIQMALGMAPLCNLRIYDAGGDTDATLTDTLTFEQSDNLADTLTESYGWSIEPATAEAAHVLHAEMSAQGMTYMNASGDSGTTLEPFNYPNVDPESLSVGGTIGRADDNGNRISETGWSEGGGGWCTDPYTFNVRPSWQFGNGVRTDVNFRMVPDVALSSFGYNGTGSYWFYENGQLIAPYQGTSFASPIFAGSLAVSEEKLISLGWTGAGNNGTGRFGRIANVFYLQNGRSDVWYDVTVGDNGTLPDGTQANDGPGWDFNTGWGAIDFDAFVKSQQLPIYRVTDLGTFGGSLSAAYGINSLGQVTGFAQAGDGTARAFIYSAGALQNLGTLGGSESRGLGINDSGQVAGYSLVGSGGNAAEHAFLYSNGTMQDLGVFNGVQSYGYALNSAGQVVGNTSTANAATNRAFLYSGGVMHDLGTLGGSNSFAMGINASGQVVGSSSISGTSPLHAFLYSGGGLLDLGTLGGANSSAAAVNSLGQIAGGSDTSTSGAKHAVTWIGGNIMDLGALGTGTDSAAESINSLGQITGFSFNGSTSTNPSAFLYSDGVMHDLNWLVDSTGAGMSIIDGGGINDKGYIAGTAAVSGVTHGVLLTPYFVDSPTSYSLFRGLLLSGGLAGLWATDETYLAVQTGPTLNSSESPVSVIIHGASSEATPSDLRLNVLAHSSTLGLTQTVEMWDFQAGAWAVVGSKSSTTSDTVQTAIASNPGRFVQSGTKAIMARVSWKQSGPVTTSRWAVFIDQAVWNVSP